MGFTGSGRAFSLPDENHYAILGFQKSAYSDAAQVRFTVNVLVVSKRAWSKAREERSYMPEKPSPNTLWGVGWGGRIGSLLPGNKDKWWRLSDFRDIERVAAELIDSIREHVLPMMQQRLQERA
jgi:Domain of unknown function (DUF4304)